MQWLEAVGYQQEVNIVEWAILYRSEDSIKDIGAKLHKERCGNVFEVKGHMLRAAARVSSLNAAGVRRGTTTISQLVTDLSQLLWAENLLWIYDADWFGYTYVCWCFLYSQVRDCLLKLKGGTINGIGAVWWCRRRAAGQLIVVLGCRGWAEPTARLQ